MVGCFFNHCSKIAGNNVHVVSNVYVRNEYETRFVKPNGHYQNTKRVESEMSPDQLDIFCVVCSSCSQYGVELRSFSNLKIGHLV